jgi:hypothetical protein
MCTFVVILVGLNASALISKWTPPALIWTLPIGPRSTVPLFKVTTLYQEFYYNMNGRKY